MAKEITNQEIFDIIDKEAKDLGIQVIVHDKLPLALVLSCGLSCAGFANAIDLSIHMFMETMRTMVDNTNKIIGKLGIFAKLTDWGRNPQKTLTKMIRQVLIHEARHLEQYHYLQSKGIDPTEYVREHNQGNYWFRRFELDAYLVQHTGIRLPLKWVLGV